MQYSWKKRKMFLDFGFFKMVFEVQDAGSQKNWRISRCKTRNACSRCLCWSWWKNLHLAALMENKGQIIAMDIHGWKLELKRRAKRAGAHNIETRELQIIKSSKKTSRKADRLFDRRTVFWFRRFKKKPRF